MIYTNAYLTVVFRDLTVEERGDLCYHPKFSASSYSHATRDVEELLSVLQYAEAALADIGDAEREPGDDLAWCENRAAEALPRIRKLIKAHGR